MAIVGSSSSRRCSLGVPKQDLLKSLDAPPPRSRSGSASSAGSGGSDKKKQQDGGDGDKKEPIKFSVELAKQIFKNLGLDNDKNWFFEEMCSNWEQMDGNSVSSPSQFVDGPVLDVYLIASFRALFVCAQDGSVTKEEFITGKVARGDSPENAKEDWDKVRP